MDTQTKLILQEARKHTPRILFRAWTNDPKNPSGGFQGLNTPDAITPRAFLHNRVATTKTVYDLPRAELRDMCQAHLGKTRRPPVFYTELSSWAASLAVALDFGFRRFSSSVFISVIDTTELPQNVIIHVPFLHPILGENGSQYPWEYLAHGIICGSALKAVRLQDILNIGTIDYPTPWRLNGMKACFTSQHSHPPISEEEITAAKIAGQMYGHKFGAVVTLAILCLRKRDCNFWQGGTKGQEEVLEASLSGFDIPTSWRADLTIMRDVVNVTGFGEVEQMIRMLRAIVNLQHKRRMRSREARL
jgi:hypothetical protein